jgi:hypothetical protein
MYTDRQKTAIVREALVNGRSIAREMYQIPESTLRGWMTTHDQDCALCGNSLATMWKDKGHIEYVNVDGIPASLVGECCLKVVEKYQMGATWKDLGTRTAYWYSST